MLSHLGYLGALEGAQGKAREKCAPNEDNKHSIQERQALTTLVMNADISMTYLDNKSSL